jgi:hypothetical protein
MGVHRYPLTQKNRDEKKAGMTCTSDVWIGWLTKHAVAPLSSRFEIAITHCILRNIDAMAFTLQY